VTLCIRKTGTKRPVKAFTVQLSRLVRRRVFLCRMPQTTHIGFPPPLLGHQPQRLPVCYDDGEVLAIVKPIDVLVTQDNWYPNLPTLVAAIAYQAGQDKPELKSLGVDREGLWAVTDLDPEVAGPVVFCRSREKADALRNDLGSHQFRFTYLLVTDKQPADASLFCDLPLARHVRQKRMLVSHTSGKRCETHFHQVGTISRRFSLWQAETSYNRLHQVRLHAFEVGLRVVGDMLYSQSPLPFLSRIKKDFRPSRKREERPLLDGPAAALTTIDLPDGSRIAIDPPAKLASFIRQAGKA